MLPTVDTRLRAEVAVTKPPKVALVMLLNEVRLTVVPVIAELITKLPKSEVSVIVVALKGTLLVTFPKARTLMELAAVTAALRVAVEPVERITTSLPEIAPELVNAPPVKMSTVPVAALAVAPVTLRALLSLA